MGIVVPVFNEASRWSTEQWRELVTQCDVRWLFVDDGSTDQSAALLHDLSVHCPQVDVMSLATNSGKAEAVRSGLLTLLDSHEFAIVGFLDADGAFSLTDIQKMVALMRSQVSRDTFDAIWSSRVALSGHDIQRTGMRHFVGRGVATLIGSTIRPMPYDTQSGFKLFLASDTLAKCLRQPLATRWLFDVEIILRWRAEGKGPLRILEVPVTSWRDVRGSKIRGREMLRIAREIGVILHQGRKQRG